MSGSRGYWKRLIPFVVLAIVISGWQPVALARNYNKAHWAKMVTEKVLPSNLVNRFLLSDLGIEDISQFNLTLKLESLRPEAGKFFSPVSAPTLAKIYEAFGRRSYNNAIILGLPGVGKSFLINQLVGLFSYGVAPDYLKPELGWNEPTTEIQQKAFIGNMDVVMVNVDLLSQNPTQKGDPYGNQEVRMKMVLNGLFEAAQKEFKASGRRTLFVLDEVATLPDIVQNTLKKLLDGTGMKDPNDEFERAQDVGYNVVAMTTPGEYRKMVNGDSAVERRYLKVEQNEPGEIEAYDILVAESEKLAKTHAGVTIDPEALEYIIGIRHLLTSPPLAMPANVLAALNDLYNWYALHPGKDKRINLLYAQRFLLHRIGLTDVWMPGPGGEPPFHDLAAQVKKLVVGQDEAVDKVAAVFKAWARLGFGGEVPVIQLIGSSGSGKNTLIEAFSTVMFGHKGRNMVFPIGVGREDDYAIDSLIYGPPLGDHADNQAPLIVQKMEGNKPAFIVFNEGKDAPSTSLVKLKDFFETTTFKPAGQDNRERPVLYPMFLVGQWGEELFKNVETDQQVKERYERITQQEVDETLIHPDTKNGRGAMPPALVQRIKRTGAIVLMKPVLKSMYADIVKLQTEEFRREQEKRNNLLVEITDGLIQFISKHAVEQKEDTRGLGADVINYTRIALSESGDHGIPLRNARIRIDYRDGQIVVSHLGEDGNPLQTWQTAPSAVQVNGATCPVALDKI